jgi:uncharacterized membrane protein YqiK
MPLIETHYDAMIIRDQRRADFDEERADAIDDFRIEAKARLAAMDAKVAALAAELQAEAEKLKAEGEGEEIELPADHWDDLSTAINNLDDARAALQDASSDILHRLGRMMEGD